MSDMKVSVASYSFHAMIMAGELDVFSYLDLLKYRYHVDYADIWNEGCLKSLDADYLKKIRKAMDEKEMSLANLCIDGPYVWCDDPEERAVHKASMLEYLKAAEILGAKIVRIDFGTDGPDRFSAFRKRNAPPEEVYTMNDEAFNYIVDTYREYCNIVADFGAKIGPENHWGWDRIPAYLKKVCDAVDHPAYGHLYHLRNFYDDPEGGEAYAVKHAMHTHFQADSVSYAMVVARKLYESGYEGTYGVEHHSGKLEPQRTEWQLATLREILAELRVEKETGVPCEKAYMNGVYKI